MTAKPKDNEYRKMVREHTPNSKLGSGCLRAFWVGGLICCIGQAFIALGEKMGMTMDQSAMFSTVILIFLGTTLTGFGVYDRIGKYAGAGSIVPITGFANSVAAPAIEFRREGLILGLGAKLFSLSGPVLTYGIITSILIGIIHHFTGIFA